MEILRLELLGGLHIRCGRRLLSAKLAKKAQALICYLAVTERPHSRDALAGLLWSDFPEHRARANLRDTLSDLQRALPQHLAIEQRTIAFIDDPAQTWIDSAVFRIYIEQAQQLLRRVPSPVMLPAELVKRVEEGLGLYRGEFLAGFYVRRAAVFEEWLDGQRERLRRLAVEALQIAAAYYTSSGDYAAGLRYARQLLELDPWREEGHRLLMRLLALSGQQSAAFRQYELCCQVLRDELGLEQAVETKALYEAIRAGEVQPDRLDTRGYELLGIIGQGETSTVYRAYQPTIRREVAIKIILPEFVSDLTFFDRFETAAQTVAQLEFPWIVPIYDYWREVDAAYLTMRFLRGGNLHSKLEEPWPAETAVRLVDQVASALAAAHEAGIVHGNLHPANILLDEDGNAYLSDFGTAGGGHPGPTSRAQSYLSPEQRQGERPTPRSDIYALGLIVTEMLAGRPTLRQAQNRIYGNGESDALERMFEESPPAPPVLRDDLAEEVDAVLRKATSGQAADRFPDVLAMASALRKGLKKDAYEKLPVHAGFFRRLGSHLPPDETPFVGRTEELFMLDKLIADPQIRLINICGPGGIGKTRLALAAARRQVDHFPHGVYFVPLVSVEVTDHIVTTIASTLELPLQDEGSPQQQLLDYLEDKRLLLILDNFEQLATGKGLLVEMVGRAAQLSILVTSREVLHCQGEQLFPIGGLTLPTSAMAEDVFQADATQLFMNSVRRLQPDFDLYETDLDALNRIFRLVESIPLAIELAAGWANKFALTHIAAQLRQSGDFLQTADHRLPERHASMQTVFATSWQQLEEHDQQVFKRLSVFRGGFTLGAARTICDISFVSLSRLVSKSLVQFDRVSDRYQMHELLRQFAARELAQDEKEEATVLSSHAAYFCLLLGEKEKDLKGSRQDIALAEIEVDLGNFRRAWNRASAFGFEELIEQAADSLSLYYRYRFLPDEFVNACRAAERHLQRLVQWPESPVPARRALAKIRAMQATPYFHATLGSDYLVTMENVQMLEESRKLFQELAAAGEHVRDEQAFVLMHLGALLLNIELDRSTPLLQESLALYRQIGNRWGQSEALFYLSSARMRLQGYSAAKPLWEESVAIKREEGDRRGLADSLAVLGMRAASHNQTIDALQYAQECYDTYVRISDRTNQAEAHWNLGVLTTWSGQYGRAKEILTKAEALYGELGLHPPALILGNVLAMLGEYDAVIEYVDTYMATVGEADYKPNEARAYNWLCYVAIARRDYPEARRLGQKSIVAYEACGLQAYAGFGYGLLALAARGMGDHESPWRFQEKGLRIQQDGNQLGPLGIWLCTPVTAVLLADAGRLEKAVAAYAFATNHPMIANSVWFDDVMGHVIRTAETKLSPVVAAQARQRGREAEPGRMGAELLGLVSEIV